MPMHPKTLALTMMTLCVAGMALWAPGVSSAQSANTVCAQLLSNVEQHLSAGCSTMDRDEVCYGNRQITVEYTNDATPSTLAKEGDTAPLSVVKSLKAGPLNPDSGEWGIAVIRAQPPGLEGTSSGQAVTFIVYGDTTLAGQAAPIGAVAQPATTTTCNGTARRATFLRANPGPNEPQIQLLKPGTPVTFSGRSVDGRWLLGESQGQKGWGFADVFALDCDPATLAMSDPTIQTLPGVSAFYFTTGVGAQSSCKDIPPAGLYVQSPKGQTVTFKLNGADIVMGSTGVFTFTPGTPNRITLWTLEGEIGVIVGGTAYRTPGGQLRTFPLGGKDGLQLVLPPGLPRPIALADRLAPIYIKTLCGVAKAAGLTVQGCDVRLPPTKVPPTPTQTAPVSTNNTCQPTQPGLPCNCNGFCDPNGESYYTCPQDCPFAPADTQSCGGPGASCGGSGGSACCAGLNCKGNIRIGFRCS
jgi:uncharacterized protein YraI